MRQVADDDGDLAQAVVGQLRREVDEGLLAGVREGLAQHEVLGRIAGQGHLGEHDEVDAVAGGLRRPLADQVGVAREVADAGVDLGQAHPELHGLLLVHGSILVSGEGERRGGGTMDARPRPA